MPRVLAAMQQAHAVFDRVDEANRVIYGVRIAELGRLACFLDRRDPENPKPRYAKISPEFVQAILTHAKDRDIISHWSHDYLDNPDKDALHWQLGVLKNHREEETTGHAIADLHAMPGVYGDKVMWAAMNSPRSMMISPVYGFDWEDEKSIPKDYRAGDVVEYGAATTALLAGFNENKQKQTTENTNNIMELKDFIALLTQALKDPTVAAAILAASGGDNTDEVPAALADEGAAAAMENAAGVTEADKKDEPPAVAKAPAVMRAFVRIAKANKRITDAGAEAAAVLAEARFTGKIGGGKILVTDLTKDKQTLPFVARMAGYIAAGEKTHTAIALAKNKATDSEYNEWETAGRPMPVATK